jgi:hypothetical protein
MKITKLGILAIGSALLLASCNGDKAPTAPVKPEAATPSVAGNDSVKGGEVKESGKYHLELVNKKEADKTHLDFILKIDATQKDIPDAKVSGEVVVPGGKQLPLTFTYSAKDKSYKADIPGKATGAYNVKINAAIGADKPSGRFTFNR